MVKLTLPQIPKDSKNTEKTSTIPFELIKAVGDYDPTLGNNCEIVILNDVKNPAISFKTSKLALRQSKLVFELHVLRHHWFSGKISAKLQLSDVKQIFDETEKVLCHPYIPNKFQDSIINEIQNKNIDITFEENEECLIVPILINPAPVIFDVTFGKFFEETSNISPDLNSSLSKFGSNRSRSSQVSAASTQTASNLKQISYTSIRSEASMINPAEFENLPKFCCHCQIVSVSGDYFPEIAEYNSACQIDILPDIHHSILAMEQKFLQVKQSQQQVNIPISRKINHKGTTKLRCIIKNYQNLNDIYKLNHKFFKHSSPIQDISIDSNCKSCHVSLPLPDRPIDSKQGQCKFTDLEVQIIDCCDKNVIDWETYNMMDESEDEVQKRNYWSLEKSDFW